jgi:hypothetical protein
MARTWSKVVGRRGTLTISYATAFEVEAYDD